MTSPIPKFNSPSSTSPYQSPLICWEPITTPEEPYTPLQAPMTILSKGTMPPDELAAFSNQNPLRTLKSPLLSSPVFLSPTQALSITPFGIDPTGPLKAIKTEGTNSSYEWFLKLRQREVRKRSDKVVMPAFPPHATPFTEVVVGCFIKVCLEKLGISYCEVPPIAYIQIGHPSVLAENSREFPQSARGTGSAQKLIKNVQSISLDDLRNHSIEQKIHPFALEVLAVLDITLLNCDRNVQNILIKPDRSIVVIDHSYTLPIGDEDTWRIKAFWQTLPIIKQQPSEKICDFIRNLDLFCLPTIAHVLENEVEESLGKLPPHQKANEEQSLKPERILPHQIAICFLKMAILEQSKTLEEVAKKLSKPSSNIVKDVYRAITQPLDPQTMEQTIRKHLLLRSD